MTANPSLKEQQRAFKGECLEKYGRYPPPEGVELPAFMFDPVEEAEEEEEKEPELPEKPKPPEKTPPPNERLQIIQKAPAIDEDLYENYLLYLMSTEDPNKETAKLIKDFLKEKRAFKRDDKSSALKLGRKEFENLKDLEKYFV